jgi:hypothetical protein
MELKDVRELLGTAGEKGLVEIRYADDEKQFWTRPGYARLDRALEIDNPLEDFAEEYRDEIRVTREKPCINLYTCLERNWCTHSDPLYEDKDEKGYLEIPIKNIMDIAPLVDRRDVEYLIAELERIEGKKKIDCL